MSELVAYHYLIVMVMIICLNSFHQTACLGIRMRIDLFCPITYIAIVKSMELLLLLVFIVAYRWSLGTSTGHLI